MQPPIIGPGQPEGVQPYLPVEPAKAEAPEVAAKESPGIIPPKVALEPHDFDPSELDKFLSQLADLAVEIEHLFPLAEEIKPAAQPNVEAFFEQQAAALTEGILNAEALTKVKRRAKQLMRLPTNSLAWPCSSVQNLWKSRLVL